MVMRIPQHVFALLINGKELKSRGEQLIFLEVSEHIKERDMNTAHMNT